MSFLLSSFFFLLVDLCHPLLVGVLSDKEEEDGEGQGERRRSGKEVFLRIKQGLALEVDTQSGQERCRLELRSLAWVETTEAAWTRGVRGGQEEMTCGVLGFKGADLITRLLAVGQSGEVRDLSLFGVFRAVNSQRSSQPLFWPT